MACGHVAGGTEAGRHWILDGRHVALAVSSRLRARTAFRVAPRSERGNRRIARIRHRVRIESTRLAIILAKCTRLKEPWRVGAQLTDCKVEVILLSKGRSQMDAADVSVAVDAQA